MRRDAKRAGMALALLLPLLACIHSPSEGNKTKLKKDPGVPKLHPFKEEIINEIREAKEKADETQKERLRKLQMSQKYKSKSKTLEQLQVAEKEAFLSEFDIVG